MKDTAGEELSGRLGIFVVSPRADIANEDYLSDLLAIPLNVDHSSLWNLGLDHSHWQTCHKAVSLSCHLLILLAERDTIPCGQVVALGDGTVGLRQTVYMDRMEVQVGHLLEQMRSRRASRDGDADGIRKLFSLVGVAEKGVDRRSSIEVGDMFLLQQFPDSWVIDLPQAVMGPADRCDRPRECPAWNLSARYTKPVNTPTHRMEQGQRPEIMATPLVRIKPGLNHIPHGRKVASTVRKLNTLGLRGCSRSIRNSKNILLIKRLGLQPFPPKCPRGGIKAQALQNSLIERARQLTLGNIRISINNDRHIRVPFLIRLHERQELLVHNNHLGLGVVEYISDVIFLESVVYRCPRASPSADYYEIGSLVLHTDVDCARRGNAEDRLQESGRVGTENPDSFVAVLLQVVGETPGSVGGLEVGSPQNLVVCCDVVDCLGLDH